jgi:hypothetical protein
MENSFSFKQRGFEIQKKLSSLFEITSIKMREKPGPWNNEGVGLRRMYG